MAQPNGTSGTISIINSNLASGIPTPLSFVQLPAQITQSVSGAALGDNFLSPGANWVTVSVLANSGTGALTARGTADGVNWYTLGPTPFLNMTTGVSSATIPSGSTAMYLVNVTGLLGIRINAEAAVGGSYTVAINESTAAYVAAGQGSTPAWFTSVAVPQSGSDTVVKATPGQLVKVLVTTLATAAISIYDNASAGSGTIIGQIPGSTAVGTVLTFNNPAALGITVKGAASQPNITVFYS